MSSFSISPSHDQKVTPSTANTEPSIDRVQHTPNTAYTVYCIIARSTVIHISKKDFRPGGMAPSEWTRSVRAVRDTQMADYSAPGVNTMRRVANRPPIAVSPFLLTLSVSYFKQTL